MLVGAFSLGIGPLLLMAALPFGHSRCHRGTFGRRGTYRNYDIVADKSGRSPSANRSPAANFKCRNGFATEKRQELRAQSQRKTKMLAAQTCNKEADIMSRDGRRVLRPNGDVPSICEPC